jgi:hypothetical protein
VTGRAVAVAILAWSSVAVAEGQTADELVASAVAAYDELRFDDALALLEQAWHRGGSGPKQLRRIFALSGQTAGAMGNADAARLWFSRWPSLDPDATLPAGSSPKLAALFAEARTGLGGASLTARAHLVGEGIEVVVSQDPLSLAARASSGDEAVDVRQGREVTLPGAAGDRIELLDRDGNVLMTIEATRLVEPPAPSTPSWYARWPVWAGTTAGLAIVSGVAYGLAVSAQSDWEKLNATSGQHEATEALAVEDSFERRLLLSRIALGGAVVTGVVSAVLFARGGEQRVTVTPTPGGASVAWTTGFCSRWWSRSAADA